MDSLCVRLARASERRIAVSLLFFVRGGGPPKSCFTDNTSKRIQEASMNLRQALLQLLVLLLISLAGCGKTESDQSSPSTDQSPSPTSQAQLSTVVLVSAPATRPAEKPESETGYVASSRSKVFHEPDCRWAKAILEHNLVKLESRAEAVASGRRPCGTCQP